MTTTIHHNISEYTERLRVTLDAAEALTEAFATNDKDQIRNRTSELTRAQNRLAKWQLIADHRSTPTAA